MFRPQKAIELKEGDKFALEANGKIYEVYRKSQYKMLLIDELGVLMPFHYFIYFKPIFLC